jgi:anti-anti-sigma regulatory factor
MDIAAVAELKLQLTDALSCADSVTLQGGQIEHVDGSSLQLLLAFFQETRLRGLAVSWLSPSDELQASAQLLGLAESLCLA